MTLAELVKEIAGQLGNGWRPGSYAYGSGSVPVIKNKDLILIFGPSPEEAHLLRITLGTPEGWPLAIDLAGDLGIGESTQRIQKQLLAAHQQLRREAFDQEAARRRNAELTGWHNRWCRHFQQWAETQKLTVYFEVVKYRGVITGLRAEFVQQPRTPPQVVRKWGAITVSADGFPAQVEYFTTDDAIHDQLKAAVEQAEAPVRQIQPPRRRLMPRRRSITA